MSSYSKRNGYGDKRSYNSAVLHPDFKEYQLIGDSQFLRFSEQLLRRERKKSNGIAYIGLCVSGQKISDLMKRVDDEFYPISQNVVLMIGTNDLLQSTPSSRMRADIESLVLKLIENGVQRLVLLTIPPVPRLNRSSDHWIRLREYNDHIRSFHNGEDVFVVDAYPKFVKNCSSKRNSLSYDSSPKQNSYSYDSSPNSRNSSCTPLFSSIEMGHVERPSVKGDLRISFGGGKREVFVTEDNDRRSSRDSFESFRSNFSSPNLQKRPRSSTGSFNDSPPPKRRSSNYSRADDDHNDRFCEDDSFNSSTSEDIDMDLFEEYFQGKGNRKDMIHLNYNGLRVIRQLIARQIEQIDFGQRVEEGRRSY